MYNMKLMSNTAASYQMGAVTHVDEAQRTHVWRMGLDVKYSKCVCTQMYADGSLTDPRCRLLPCSLLMQESGDS